MACLIFVHTPTMFWRSFSHWVGGMGVLVFVMAVLPMSDDRSMVLMRAEVPGPTASKLVPRMRQTAKILYGTYSVMTLVLIVLLLLGGMILVVLGIMGEYVGRIYMCANAAPQYVEREVIRHEGDNA